MWKTILNSVYISRGSAAFFADEIASGTFYNKRLEEIKIGDWFGLFAEDEDHRQITGILSRVSEFVAIRESDKVIDTAKLPLLVETPAFTSKIKEDVSRIVEAGIILLYEKINKGFVVKDVLELVKGRAQVAGKEIQTSIEDVIRAALNTLTNITAEAKPISLSKLEAPSKLCVVMYGIATLVFLCELLSFRVQQHAHLL